MTMIGTRERRRFAFLRAAIALTCAIFSLGCYLSRSQATQIQAKKEPLVGLNFNDLSSKHQQRRLTQLDPKTVVQKNNYPYYSLSANIPIYRPTIHTFWAPVKTLSNGDKGTGMTDDADNQMFELWRLSWEAIGWQVRVLTLDDARKHPRYNEFYSKLQDVPLWGNRRKGVNREYNQWCYIRWLAMVVVGGGWMSDYDILPVRRIPHYIGKFTAHQGGVPSLVSGTEEEWSRMAWAILEDGVLHNTPDTELWSDMNAFTNIQDKQHVVINQSVVEATPLMTGKPWIENECNLLQKYDAIHFSHNSIRMGVTREGEKFRDRPRIAARIMKLYHSHCAGDTGS